MPLLKRATKHQPVYNDLGFVTLDIQPLTPNLSHPLPDFGQLVQGRRSIRRYQARPIDPRLLETLLEAAIWAPSAHNRQPWRFCVVTSDAAKQALSAQMAEHWRADLGGDGADPRFYRAAGGD